MESVRSAYFLKQEEQETVRILNDYGGSNILQGRALYGPIPVKTETFRELSGPLVHTFSWGNSYGPMVLKVLLKFPPTLVLVHGWLFPVLWIQTP